MHETKIIFDVLIFLLAAVIVVPLFHRLKIGSVLGYLAAGISVGPFGFALIKDTGNAQTLAEFGVLFLLFMVGLELSVKRLGDLRRFVFGLGFLQVVITGAIIAALALTFGATREAAAIIGAGLALSSTAFVLQILKEKGELTSEFGQVSFAILLLQDIAVVPLLILVGLLGQGEESFLSAIGMAALKATVALMLVVGFGRLLLRPIFKFIAKTGSSELFTAMTLLTVLGAGWLLSLGGLSMALGAFLAGLLLAETEYRHQVEADIHPFRGILLGLFFMTVGMSMDFGIILESLWLISLLVVALLVGKTFLTTVLCLMFKFPLSMSVRVGAVLSQGGEFGFIIFSTAGLLGLLAPEMTQILLAIIALSMMLTPAMAFAGTKISRRILTSNKQFSRQLKKSPPELKDHIIIVGFGRVGQTIARISEEGGIPYIGIDMDPDLVLGCRKKGMNVFFGNADQIEIIKAVGAKKARGAAVTIDKADQVNKILSVLNEYAPTLPLFVRTQDLEHSRQLKIGGQIEVVPETVEASFQLAGKVMQAFGFSPDKIFTILEEFRKDDYAKLEKLFLREKTTVKESKPASSREQ